MLDGPTLPWQNSRPLHGHFGEAFGLALHQMYDSRAERRENSELALELDRPGARLHTYI